MEDRRCTWGDAGCPARGSLRTHVSPIRPFGHLYVHNLTLGCAFYFQVGGHVRTAFTSPFCRLCCLGDHTLLAANLTWSFFLPSSPGRSTFTFSSSFSSAPAWERPCLAGSRLGEGTEEGFVSALVTSGQCSMRTFLRERCPILLLESGELSEVLLVGLCAVTRAGRKGRTSGGRVALCPISRRALLREEAVGQGDSNDHPSSATLISYFDFDGH